MIFQLSGKASLEVTGPGMQDATHMAGPHPESSQKPLDQAYSHLMSVL